MKRDTFVLKMILPDGSAEMLPVFVLQSVRSGTEVRFNSTSELKAFLDAWQVERHSQTVSQSNTILNTKSKKI
jgi:hypothetical protein